jgi:dihydrofolate reductase
MAKLVSFLTLTLDGYFGSKDGTLDWSHKNDDEEFREFVSGNARGGGALLFGRITYEMMVSYWPTEQAKKAMPDVAKGMNEHPKFVVSRTLTKSDWNNTKVLNGDLSTEIQKLKKEANHITILGSGSVLTQLADADLVDEFHFVVSPILLGSGRTAFQGMKKPLDLRLVSTRTFKNGNIFSSYEPKRG